MFSQLTLALDLEGTLISNAMSCFARPGLFQFMEFCRAQFPRVVMFTFVPQERVRAIFDILISEGEVPAWVAGIEVVAWSGHHKDLRFVTGAVLARTLLVDDHKDCVHPDQTAQWVPIAAYEPPYSKEDRELERVTVALRHRLACAP
jgi:hypothetical protein